jgi:hypothetical protein
VTVTKTQTTHRTICTNLKIIIQCHFENFLAGTLKKKKKKINRAKIMRPGWTM